MSAERARGMGRDFRMMRERPRRQMVRMERMSMGRSK